MEAAATSATTGRTRKLAIPDISWLGRGSAPAGAFPKARQQIIQSKVARIQNELIF
jgi:hypothetical protein